LRTGKPANSEQNSVNATQEGPLTGRARSNANLQPITKETARELGRRGNERKAQIKKAREEAQKATEERTRERLAYLAYEAYFQALESPETPIASRINAANSALDRLEGRPTQRVEQTNTDQGTQKLREELATMTPEELRELVRTRTREVA
jgi:hypothetical protein